jgi:ribosomal protein S18 acetylase RimI-like enzyme
MVVFPATINDVPIIQHIASLTWPIAYAEILTPGQLGYMLQKMYSQPTLLKQMTEEGHNFFMVSDNGQTIGFAGVSRVTDAHVPGTYHEIYKLHKLYVLPSCHKTGAGKKLMDTVFDFIRSKGGDYLVLNVNRNNPAFNYYVKKGFDILESGDFDIGCGFYMKDYIMGKPLDSE